MAVPGFQEMFLPFLQCLADGQPRHVSAIREFVEDYFQLSPEDREELIPSGQSTKAANRVGWARTHLSKAGLIERTEWGVYHITEAGRNLVANPPAQFDLRFLDTIPQHKEWFHASRSAIDAPVADEAATATQPPNERIEEAFSQLNASLAAELLAHMLKMDPFRFEQLVVDLLFKMGYGGSREEAAKVTKKTGDEGIDGVINEDRLGLDVIYIQAKRWQGNVGRNEIEKFVGALAGKHAHKGVFITTSGFVQTAIDYARSIAQRVILIDGQRLAELMIEHGIGVTTTREIKLKRIDSDYFEEA
jgi:restriction system protein